MRYCNTGYRELIGYDFACDVANRIIEGRKQKEWTQAQLAKESGIPQNRLARIENVQLRVRLEDVEKIADVLNVTVDWLIDAQIDSQVGECLYTVADDRYPDFKLYMRATSTRMAYLKMLKRADEMRFQFQYPRSRAIVTLVGVPVTEKELQTKYGKAIDKDNDEILPDKKE